MRDTEPSFYFRYEKKQKAEGHTVNHAFAKELLAGIAAGEVRSSPGHLLTVRIHPSLEAYEVMPML